MSFVVSITWFNEQNAHRRLSNPFEGDLSSVEFREQVGEIIDPIKFEWEISNAWTIDIGGDRDTYELDLADWDDKDLSRLDVGINCLLEQVCQSLINAGIRESNEQP